MPLGFWGDPDGARYRAAYFERFPGVWHHGDWTMETERGGYVIHGRSDAVLNPGGVRIGTAEIYRQVERLDQVVESIAVGQEWDGDVRVILFVKLRDGVVLDAELEAQDQARDPREHLAAPRPGQDPPGRGHSTHAQRQDHRARGARRGARARGEERRRAGESGGAGALPQPAGARIVTSIDSGAVPCCVDS